MFTLMRALTYAVLFIGFVLVFLPGQLLEWAGVTRPSHIGAPQIAGAVLVAGRSRCGASWHSPWWGAEHRRPSILRAAWW